MNPILVFTEGILSFFSPCILPLLPIYMGYLSQNAKSVDEQGNVVYRRASVLKYTICFIFGVSCTFLLMAFAVHSARNIFEAYHAEISLFGAAVVLVMGLVQLDVIRIPFLMQDHSLMHNLDLRKMNGLKAFLMGFLFSFSWTPCIGPYLTSIVVMAASSADALQGILLIGWYALGFLVPFLALGLFTSEVLRLLKSKQKVFQVAIKLGGIILIGMGLWMGMQALNEMKGSQTLGSSSLSYEERELKNEQDFILYDQHGAVHQLSDYEGKTVVVTFVASWCHYCTIEMASLNETWKDDPEVVHLVVIMPGGNDLSKEELLVWIEEQGYEFPVLFDEDGSVFYKYGVSGLPTNYFVFPNGDVHGYVPGYLTTEQMKDVINQTKAGPQDTNNE